MNKIMALLMAAWFALCTTGTAEGGTFELDLCIASEPDTVDPGRITSSDAAVYTLHQFEGLLRYELTDAHPSDDPTVFSTAIGFGQASDVSISEDRTVYAFTLRDDILWSDGIPVTAGDFEYAWKRLVDPATASAYSDLLNGVVLKASDIRRGIADPDALGVKAVDDQTFVVTLEHPCAFFLTLCAFPALMPLRRDVVENHENWTDPEHIVVNGPYIVTEWIHGSAMRMEKNPAYYGRDRVGPDALNWHLIDDENAVASGFLTGDLQFIDNIPLAMRRRLRATGDLFINPEAGIYYLWLDCEKLSDWRVRAALALSVDLDGIARIVESAADAPAVSGFVIHGLHDHTGAAFCSYEPAPLYAWLNKAYPDAGLDSYAGHCALAAQLYDEAVTDGAWDSSNVLVYQYNSGDSHTVIAEACANDWRKVLDIETILESREWSAYTASLAEHRFDVARMSWIADYDDALTCLELLTTGQANNYSRYSNENFDALIAAARLAPAGAARDQLLHDAEALLFSKGCFPVIPLYYYSCPYCKAPDIDRVGYSPFGYWFFQYAVRD